MSETCTCSRDSIDGLNIAELSTWELALRNAAHGHYPLPNGLLPDAVREIDRLRRALADCVTGVTP